MRITTKRQKPRILWLSMMYRLQKLLPLSSRTKLKIFLNLEWLFDRLSHEMSFKYYPSLEHPFRLGSKDFILENITEKSTVLDIGCNVGDISYIIAAKAKEVIGIDYNKKAIEAAKIRYQRNNLRFYNREALEYLKENSNHFDILILSHILEHLDNPTEFLMNFKNYFTQIYIEVPDFDRNYLNHYRQNLKLDLIYSDSDHISEFDRNELKTLLQQCNIHVDKEEYKFGVQRFWCTVNK